MTQLRIASAQVRLPQLRVYAERKEQLTVLRWQRSGTARAGDAGAW